MHISFTGRSDDLVHVNFRPDLGRYAYKHIDEYDCYDRPLLFLVDSGDKSMFVYGLYMANGTWAFLPVMRGEGIDTFFCVVTRAHESSMELLLTCPDGTTVEYLND